MSEKGKNIPANAAKPAPNAVTLPGGSYDFIALEKALEKAVEHDDENDRNTAVNEVLADQQQNEKRDSVPLPPGHEITEVKDAQGNLVRAAVPILEKGEAVETEPAPPVVTPASAGGATKDAPKS